jgi:hypothetical protein
VIEISEKILDFEPHDRSTGDAVTVSSSSLVDADQAGTLLTAVAMSTGKPLKVSRRTL